MEPDPDAESDAEFESEFESESDTELDAESDTELDAESDTEFELDADSAATVLVPAPTPATAAEAPMTPLMTVRRLVVELPPIALLADS